MLESPSSGNVFSRKKNELSPDSKRNLPTQLRPGAVGLPTYSLTLQPVQGYLHAQRAGHVINPRH